MDPAIGTLPRADVLIRDGVIAQIGPRLDADGAEIIDATRMIVMPGFVDSHTHMWSTLGRNFISDGGFSYYPAKWATAAVFTPDDFYNSLMLGFAELANGGVTTVHNWSHNNPSPDHADAELRAHQHSLMRGRYSLGHVDRMPPDVVNRYEDLDRIQREWFADGGRFDGLVHLGVNLRGIVQSEARVFHEEMAFVMRADCRSVFTQRRPNRIWTMPPIMSAAAISVRRLCFRTISMRATAIARQWPAPERR